ncbi:flotillin family protein [Myxococcota bacterium]|nr:flotillin family protein [Myxococcota bacterium]MBU1380994.1 flotillin family protein [Myxococcota bacterium]MBU1496621.1 flotillin family protein [Myxococcota bacterium]
MTIAAVAGGLVLFWALSVFILFKTLYVVPAHNELVVISGKSHNYGDKVRGYRYISNGQKSFRMPFTETVSVMSLKAIPFSTTVKNAYMKGGKPSTMDLSGTFTISKDPQNIHNAIERFLGQSESQIKTVFTETMEGVSRGVLATMTPDELLADNLYFTQSVLNESERNFSKLGLTVENLTVTNIQVTKERNKVNTDEAPF